MSKKPNIVVIMADDLGFECLGCNGGTSYRTPQLDTLARTGMRFEHCYSQPLCTPSRVQIMTGRYNFRNYEEFGYLNPKEVTFGNVLKDAGYATCIVGKWQLNGISKEKPRYQDNTRPYDAGFDEYCLWQLTKSKQEGERYANPLIEQNGKILDGLEDRYGPDVFCEYGLDFIERHKEGPFFLYYPMVMTHAPFVPTPDSKEWKTGDRYEHDTRFFADMVAYTDKIVGHIVKKLDELGIRENTIVMFTGDNGTALSITSQMVDREVRGGKSTMPDAGTHVPLVANWKGVMPEGKVSHDLIDFSDMLPTLADAAGAPLPENVELDGRSFLPQLRGEKGAPREWVFCHYYPRHGDANKAGRFAREQRFKLYHDGRFYNVPSDYLEQNDLDPETLDANTLETRQKLQSVVEKMKNEAILKHNWKE